MEGTQPLPSGCLGGGPAELTLSVGAVCPSRWPWRLCWAVVSRVCTDLRLGPTWVLSASPLVCVCVCTLCVCVCVLCVRVCMHVMCVCVPAHVGAHMYMYMHMHSPVCAVCLVHVSCVCMCVPMCTCVVCT